ncbi:phosphate ABC transporter permease subunit PstC [Candidatus Pelagibacter sp. HIMB1517]|uniref:phosphate ABC transporter permease subunit PstC n=1 Tax=Candidatus Pelagibacter sp. HIMB1517 TaxID=3413341 RepID=UPI003F872BDA
MNSLLILALILFGFTSFYFGKSRIKKVTEKGDLRPKALPHFYGYYQALWCALPAFLIIAIWTVFEPIILKNLIENKIQISSLNEISQDELNLIYSQIISFSQGNFSGQVTKGIEAGAITYKNLLSISQGAKVSLFFCTIIAASLFAFRQINKNVHAREGVEKTLTIILFLSSVAAILTTIGIIFSLLFETIQFFTKINPLDFFFGLGWSPQKAFISDPTNLTPQEAKDLKEAFGAVPLFAGTAFIAFIAMCVAVPIGLYSGIYLAEYATSKQRKWGKPIIEILAGVPTVVYGFFAALTVGPFFRVIGDSIGLEVSSESALAAGLVMGVMIIPFVSSLSDDVINAVPQSLREGSYAMGATKSETIKKVIFPAALPGIVGSILLAVSRAIGETMIVVMAAGLAANLTINPLEATTTITTQIVMILVGDQEFTSAKTQSAFALGLTLFVLTLILNFIALRIVKKYREKYD